MPIYYFLNSNKKPLPFFIELMELRFTAGLRGKDVFKKA
jgi:hypothetical protein